jgi:hypothetical protein
MTYKYLSETPSIPATAAQAKPIKLRSACNQCFSAKVGTCIVAVETFADSHRSNVTPTKLDALAVRRSVFLVSSANRGLGKLLGNAGKDHSTNP